MGKAKVANIQKILGREDILGASDLRRETVHVPEWGGSVIIRSMTGKERDQFEKSHLDQGRGARDYRVKTENIRAHLLSLTIIDEDGKRLFPKPEDIEALGQKSSAILDRLFAVAQELSGITRADVEELAGN